MGDFDIKAQLQEAKQRKWDDRTLAQRAADMAQDLLAEGLRCLHSDERTLLSALSRLVADEKNRDFLAKLCSRVLHTPDSQQQADNLRSLLHEFGGVPTFFSAMGRLRFKAATMAARSLQGTAMGEVRRIFHATFGELCLMGSKEKVERRIREAGKEGLDLALQPLTPTVFGRKGAAAYANKLSGILGLKDASIAVQPWRLCPAISPFAPETSAKALEEALLPLLRDARSNRPAPAAIVIESGTSDILPIIAEGVKLALSRKENHQAKVILELPACLRSAPAALRDLTEWATARASRGGGPLRVMLVKGSHLSEERDRAFAYGPAHAAAMAKAETETRYKQLLHTAIAAKSTAIQPVIGTHNIFDIAYALLDWGRSGRDGLPPFIFRAGLGNHLGRLLAKAGAEITLTTPLVSEDNEASGFEHYLLGLLHELSRPDGFLTVGYAPESNSMGWGRMRQHFLAALSGRETQEQPASHKETGYAGGHLGHVLDRAYVNTFFATAEAEHERKQPLIPLLIGGESIPSPLTCIRRSLTAPGMEEYRFISADYQAVDKALHLATQAAVGSVHDLAARRRQLKLMARQLETNRANLGALLVRDAGFTFEDAEHELLHAIDACLYYEQSAGQDGLLDGTHPTPLGVVVVAASRIHPLAEAISGIAAAWVTGNAVIYKPAESNTLLGMHLARVIYEAGLTPPMLQCLPCLDNEIALKLMTDQRVDGVIECLSPALSRKIRDKAPASVLCCQPTGNTTVYLAPQSNWQQAVPDIIKAAFRRSGQSPTCPHVLLVHASIYDNQHFINALKDAVSSLNAEPGWRESAQLGPLAAPLEEEQLRQLSASNKEGAWLAAPSTQEIGSLLWKPGIRTGISAHSPFIAHARQLPALALIRVENTAQATALQRELSAGQAAAIYSWDDEEIQQWKHNVNCAQVSINCCPAARPGLHPFGSNPQPSATPLPGGPNFLTSLCHWQETARPQRRGKQRNIPFSPWETLVPKPSPEDAMRLTSAADSISYWWENEFGATHTLCSQPGEQATLAYLAAPVCLRVEKETSDIDLSIALMAALKAGSKVEISIPTARPWMPRILPNLAVELHEENRDEFIARFPVLASSHFRVRDASATPATWAAAATCRLHLSNAPVLANGRLELLHCMQEQTTTSRSQQPGL